VIDPNMALTGRTTVYAALEVCDHERGEWTAWQPDEVLDTRTADEMVQRAVDAGHDDIQLVVHVSGAVAPVRNRTQG